MKYTIRHLPSEKPLKKISNFHILVLKCLVNNIDKSANPKHKSFIDKKTPQTKS
jgi:hypothetical protein